MSCSNICRSGRSVALRRAFCAAISARNSRPLNLYGLAGLSAAVVDGLIALTRLRIAPHRSDEAQSAERA